MGYSSGSVITEISFEFNGWGTDYNANKQLIKIGNTSFSEFPNTQTNPIDYNDILTSELTTVKDTFNISMPSQASVNYGEHWIKFNFETPFVYNGENILISWENHDGSWASGYGWLEGTNYSPKLISHFWHNDDNYPTLPSTEKSSEQPNIKLGVATN